MTFHALAYSIVHPQEKLIYDDEEAGSKELSRTVQNIIDKRLRNFVWASRIKSVMLSHFKGNWETIQKQGNNLSKEEQLLYRRSLPNQTLKGDYVKSFGEKAIANILFEHDIEYKYEKSFYWTDGTIYHPDFTISAPGKRQVIIEYFGLAGDPEYDRQIILKRDYWRKRNTPLIEIYPKDIAGDQERLLNQLLRPIKAYGVQFRKLSEDEIWKRIKDRAIDDFTMAIRSFIGRCRKKDLSAGQLKELIQGNSIEIGAEKEFLKIAADIYDEYLKKIQREKLEDFDGLVSRATECIKEGKTDFDRRDNRGDLKELSFIMIDEYQDFSYLFDSFLVSIRSVCPDAGIFCVGDDWQAINAFAGSAVEYFQNFTNRYTDSVSYTLKTNYRSKKEIVNAGTSLMSERDDHNTPIKAANTGNGTVRVGYLSSFKSSTEEQSTHRQDTLTPAVLRLVSDILKRGKRVVFLMRANDRLPIGFICRVDSSGSCQERFLATVQSFFPPDVRKRITASTTHKYKGKEEDTVIVLDAVQGFYPLIHPTWIFQRIFGDTLSRIIEEEKRLFYVAISRPKDELYILTAKGEESPFLSCLGGIKRINWDDYAPFKTDDVSIKIEICNQNPQDSSHTFAIKEKLKENQYSWDSKRKVWYRFYPSESFDLAEIFDQSWVQTANHIKLIRYDVNNKVEDAYLFVGGSITKLTLN